MGGLLLSSCEGWENRGGMGDGTILVFIFFWVCIVLFIIV